MGPLGQAILSSLYFLLIVKSAGLHNACQQKSSLAVLVLVRLLQGGALFLCFYLNVLVIFVRLGFIILENRIEVRRLELFHISNPPYVADGFQGVGVERSTLKPFRHSS